MISLVRRSFPYFNVSLLDRERCRILSNVFVGFVHTEKPTQPEKKQEEKSESTLALYSTFENAKDREKESFLHVIYNYTKHNRLRRGHVAFIKAALKYMNEFGVNKDLEVYKKILDVLPKGPFIPENAYQVMLYHYPPQQDVAVELLAQMEDNGVLPDPELEMMIKNIFGNHAQPLKRLYRMAYWMPKFRNLNPWPVPDSALSSPRMLAKIAINKISSVDVQSEISEFETKDVEDAIDDTWIVSAMSPIQEELLKVRAIGTTLFVEGPFTVWVAQYTVDYFVLRGEPIPRKKKEIDVDDVSHFKIPFWQEREVELPRTIHEQDDGIYYAMCASGMSTKDSLLSWIRCLQKKNPVLEKIPIVFRLTSSVQDTGTKYVENEEAPKQLEESTEEMARKIDKG